MNTPITEISGDGYPDEIHCFRSLCRNYNASIYWLEKMEKTAKETAVTSAEMQKKYRILKENVGVVNQTLQKIQENYGRKAEQMVRQAYISGVNRRKIAARYHISENVLQNKYRTWLCCATSDEGGEQA
jgi:hypothetical protein